jgi:hypothetical protein
LQASGTHRALICGNGGFETRSKQGREKERNGRVRAAGATFKVLADAVRFWEPLVTRLGLKID